VFRYIGHAAVLALGIAAGQGLAMLMAPVLTRLVTPEAFGPFSVFLAIMAMLSAPATMGYEPALVTLKNDKDVDILGGAILWITLIIGVAASLVLVPASSLINTSVSPLYFLLMAPALFSVGLYGVFHYRATRYQEFKRLSLAGFLNNLCKILCQVLLALVAGGGTLILIIGDIIGRFPAIMPIGKPRQIITLMAGALAQKQAAFALLRDNRKFMQYSMPSTLLETIAIWAFIPIVGWLYGAHEAGLVAFMVRLISGIGVLISKTSCDVYHSMARHHLGSSMLLKITLATLLALLALMSLLWGGIYWIGESGFIFVFGTEWAGLGQVAFLMGPVLLFTSVLHVFSRFTMIVEKQELRLYYFIALLVGITILTGWSYLTRMSFEVMITLYSALVLGLSVLFLGGAMGAHARQIHGKIAAPRE